MQSHRSGVFQSYAEQGRAGGKGEGLSGAVGRCCWMEGWDMNLLCQQKNNQAELE